MLNLPNIYNTKNSKEIAQELLNTQIKDHHRTVSLDIKDLCVNLPIEDILQVTKSWLQKQKHNNSHRANHTSTRYHSKTELFPI
jgi:hypothetical protein